MMEALALKAIPSFVEGVIGSNLSNLASKEVGLLLGVRGEIAYIIVELQMMKAFLRSAEEKQETDSMAREWVRLVREVSLDMENCMDKFEIYLKRQPNSFWSPRMPRSTMKIFLKSVEERQETDSTTRTWVQRIREVSMNMDICLDKFKIYLKRLPNRPQSIIKSFLRSAESGQQTCFLSVEERQKTDFITVEERQETDFIIEEERQETDSIIPEERQKTESIIVEERHETDSMSAEEMHDTDSIIAEERQKIDSIIVEERHEIDSVIAEERQETDSMSSEDMPDTDSLIVEERQKKDSIIVEERPETYSIIVEERQKTDSIIVEERHETDSIIVEERQETDSIIVEARQETDSISAEERQEIDSLSAEERLDMGNCLDKFKIYLKRLPNNNFFDWLGSRLHSLCTIRVRHEIAVEIQDLKYRISHISDCRSRYGITATTSSSSNYASSAAPRFINHRLDALFTQEDQLVGIDKPREKLMNLLIGNDKQRRVITVFGMGGLGKTTLTNRVYEDPQMVGKYFDCRAWIIVSQSLNLNMLLRDIIKQVSSPEPKMDPHNAQKNDIDKTKKKEDFDNMQIEEDLIKQLRKLLQEKRYIIVLDDIWSINAWESIKHALPENQNRSRVIITTRIEDVAKHCCADAGGADYIYKMQLLSKVESMELLEKRVFGPNKLCPMNLKKEANEIITKCGRLPLAIIAMAGILKSMPHDPKQWSNLLNNLPSILETNSSLECMKQVLLLSYNHLPYLLKPCFLYLSIFPEDHIIKRKNLTQLWIAEGLVTNQYAMSSEVVAEYYFNELVSRSLIMPLEVGWNGKVKSCRIHDVMLEVLVFKAMDENMVSIHGKQSRTTLRDGNAIRRLSLQGDRNQIRCPLDDVDLSRVTSLSIYVFQKIPPAFFPRFRLLRVLVVEYCSFKLEERGVFLRILSKLRNLRYLSLKGTFLRYLEKSVLTFSKSLGKLQNLVTLDIRNIGIYPQLSSVAKLRQLRHFLIGDSTLFPRMKPGKLRYLKDLQTLVGLDITNIKITKELWFLTQLRILKIIVDLDNPKILSPLCVSLDNLSGSLLSLRIEFWRISTPASIVPLNFNFDINKPPSLLQRLHLFGFCKIPDWVRSLSNLAKLTLDCDGQQLVNNLKVIKNLPNLLCLTVSCSFFHNSRMWGMENVLIARGGFQKLKFFKTGFMDDVYSIEFQEECMPVLEKIVIKDGRSMFYLIGIQFLPCLQKIQFDSYSMKDVIFDAEIHENIPKFMLIYGDDIER